MKYYLAVLMLVVLITSCTTDDIGSGTGADSRSDMVQLALDVTETGWQGEKFSVNTRSGETLESMKGNEGFGIFGWGLLGASQRHVVWDSDKGMWDSGEYIYWVRNTSDASTFDIYAYAPYKPYPSYNFKEIFLFETPSTYKQFNYPPSSNPPYGDTDETTPSGKITVTVDDNKESENTDLLYAGATVNRSDGLAKLEFKHAMARLTLGSLTNNTGMTINLTGITLTAKGGSGYLNKGAVLNLKTGVWSDHIPGNESVTIPLVSSVNIPDKYTIPANRDSRFFIPNANGKLPLTVTISLVGGETFVFDIELEQGKDKTYSISIEKNFEVVITN